MSSKNSIDMQRRSVAATTGFFYKAPGFTIPEPDNFADFICFFSVFTHLLHQDTYRYLRDAHHVLKP